MTNRGVVSVGRLLVAILGVAAMAQLVTWDRADAQASFNAYQDAVLADSPSFYATFDEGQAVDVIGGVAMDEGGNGALVFESNTPLATGQSVGTFGEDFDTFNPKLTSEASAEANAALTQSGNASLEVLFWNGGEIAYTVAGTSGFNIAVTRTQMEVRLSDGSSFSSDTVLTSAVPTVGAWSHIAVVHRVQNIPNVGLIGEAELYLNGLEMDSAETDGGLRVPTLASLSLLDLEAAEDYGFDLTLVDEVAVYQRALSALDVAQHAALAGLETTFNGYQESVLSDSPLVYVTFDGSAANVAGTGIPTQLTEGTFDQLEQPLASGASLTVEGFYVVGPALRVPRTPDSAVIEEGEVTVEALFLVAPDASVRPFQIDGTVTATVTGFGDITVTAEPGTGETYFGAANAGEWMHLALVHDQSTAVMPPNADEVVTGGELRTYLNGQLLGTIATDGILASNGGPDVADALWGTSDDILIPPLFVDEFAIYGRPLSQAEIQSHVAAIGSAGGGDGLPVPPTGAFVEYSVATAANPFCTVDVDTLDGFCFEQSSDRESYIQGTLIGDSELGTIWIGNVGEEVVAP